MSQRREPAGERRREPPGQATINCKSPGGAKERTTRPSPLRGSDIFMNDYPGARVGASLHSAPSAHPRLISNAPAGAPGPPEGDLMSPDDAGAEIPTA